jgi:hypothetical protein
VDDDSGAGARCARVLAVLLPSVPGEVLTTADALRHGVTQRQLEWAVRNGTLHRLRRGVLCRAEVWATASPEDRLVLRARAVALNRAGQVPVIFSHATAAALHGLPVRRGEDEIVWLTVPPGARTGREHGVVQQAAPLADDEVTAVHGLPCTTPARTVADCLRHLDALSSVPIGDAALRRRLLSAEDVEAAVDRHRWPRAAAATALLPLLDGRRESPVESRSAVVMHRYDVPRPAEQVRILDERSRFVGRPDFVWLEEGVVGEADGLGKYDGDAGTVVADERARQARLQALGLIVVRWTEQQLYGDPPLLVQQLRAALAAGRGGTFRGRVA